MVLKHFNFLCKEILFGGFYISKPFFEKNILDILNIKYVETNDINLLDLADESHIIICYLYRELEKRQKKYYIGPIHSGIIEKVDKSIVLTDCDGSTTLDCYMAKCFNKSRFTTVYPFNPNGKALIIDKNIKRDINRDTVRQVINNNLFQWKNNAVKSLDNIYSSFYNSLERIGKLGNSAKENRIFVIQCFIYKKCFVENKFMYQDYFFGAFGELFKNKCLESMFSESMKLSLDFFDLLDKCKEYLERKKDYYLLLMAVIKKLHNIDTRIYHSIMRGI
ncbi:MAG: hypothetical protein NC235_06365 [Clostridiales bacterium]|nr:hypothetical protein [Clostridiales bacterium]